MGYGLFPCQESIYWNRFGADTNHTGGVRAHAGALTRRRKLIDVLV